MQTKQQGFSLIELVVVIVILGVLAVTVAPRFLNLQGDAHRGVLEGVSGSLQSANAMINSKAILSNATGATGDVNISTTDTATTVELVHGRLGATVQNMRDVLDIDTTSASPDFVVALPTTLTTPASVTIRPSGAKATCIITYTQAADATTLPTYNVAAANQC